VDQPQFNERDHLAWSRFILANLAAALVSADADERARTRLSEAWRGLGAQGVEGAMLSMVLTLESMGCRIRSSQISPDNGEIIVEPFPGTGMLDGLDERFEIGLDTDDWRALNEVGSEEANRVYDILGAIADGAGLEYVRETTSDGDVRLVLRPW
jgi:hypothetical protein